MQPVVKALGVNAFNHTITPLYRVAMRRGDSGTVLLLDCSYSMNKHQPEVKAALSAWKCLTDTQGKYNVPEPNGRTSLLDALNDAIKEFPGLQTIMVLSDGKDTSSVATEYIVRMNNGAPEMAPLPEVGGARDDAIIQHMVNLGIQVHIVGVGHEVKEFIKKTQVKGGRSIVAAHIEQGSSPQDVAAVINTVTKAGRQRAAADGPGPEPTLITADNAEPLSAAEFRAVKAEIRITTTNKDRIHTPRLLADGPVYDDVAQTRYVDYVIEKTTEVLNTKHPGITDKVKAVIAWFLDYVQSADVPVAGDLISGVRRPAKGKAGPTCVLFDVPHSFDDLKPSAWTGALRSVLLRLARDPRWLADKINTKDNKLKVAGLTDAFEKEIANGEVGPLFCDLGQNLGRETFLAITKTELPSLNEGFLDWQGNERQVEGVLYFKYKDGSYTHYQASHRAKGFKYIGLIFGLPHTCHAGNSAASTYGGPNVGPPAGPPAGPMDVSALAAQVTGLKRRIDELEGANKQLVANMQAMQRGLA